jgi:hypothetical protein
MAFEGLLFVLGAEGGLNLNRVTSNSVLSPKGVRELCCERWAYTQNGSKARRLSHGGVIAMSEATVRFPVTCPKCGKERLTKFPLDVVADALLRGTDICLVATCHDVIWHATDLELEQIREYLGAVGLDTEGRRRGAL